MCVRSFYHLPGETYTRFLFFAPRLQLAKTAKATAYAKHHNSARKRVERLFEVLFQQFNIIAIPCCIVYLDDAKKGLIACFILYNMISDSRGYRGNLRFRRALRLEDQRHGRVVMDGIERVDCRHTQAAVWKSSLDGVEDISVHKNLKNDFLNHTWSTCGDMQDEEERGELRKGDGKNVYYLIYPGSGIQRLRESDEEQAQSRRKPGTAGSASFSSPSKMNLVLLLLIVF